jgi:uncharacterized protein
MPVDHIGYDLLIQDALRSVLRTVLNDVAVKGLPGDHHFYITFDTRIDGVRMSARLRESYPQEMKIVLQHQFWDLKVEEDDFEVGLTFNGIPERLHIPFRAVKVFVDPSVEFGLQFTLDTEEARETGDDGAETTKPAAEPLRAPELAPATAAPDEPTPAEEEGSADVVRLDRFRKK